MHRLLVRAETYDTYLHRLKQGQLLMSCSVVALLFYSFYVWCSLLILLFQIADAVSDSRNLDIPADRLQIRPDLLIKPLSFAFCIISWALLSQIQWFPDLKSAASLSNILLCLIPIDSETKNDAYVALFWFLIYLFVSNWWRS